MRVEGRWRRTIERDEAGTVIVLDQSKLPYEIEWLPVRTLAEAAVAIAQMKVRGAQAARRRDPSDRNRRVRVRL